MTEDQEEEQKEEQEKLSFKLDDKYEEEKATLKIGNFGLKEKKFRHTRDTESLDQCR